MIVLDSSKAMGETGFNTARRTLNVSTAQHPKPQKSFTSNFSIQNLVGSLKILSLYKCIFFAYQIWTGSYSMDILYMGCI